MIQTVNNAIFYHICIYEDYRLRVNQSYNTKGINRTYSKCKKEKQEIESKFEECRLQNYSNLPSRKNCFYVCLEKDVEIWLKELIRHHRYGFQIFKLSCSGFIFWADSYLFSDEDIRNPQKYWNGCSPSDYNCLVEGLFIGDYDVIEDCTHNFRSPM